MLDKMIMISPSSQLYGARSLPTHAPDVQGRGTECAGLVLAGPRSDRERLENLHPHFNIRMGRELGGRSPL